MKIHYRIFSAIIMEIMIILTNIFIIISKVLLNFLIIYPISLLFGGIASALLEKRCLEQYDENQNDNLFGCMILLVTSICFVISFYFAYF